MMDPSSDPSSTPLSAPLALLHQAQRKHQAILDRWTPFVLHRWLATAGLAAVFMLRIVLSQGWYIDALAIYILNLLLAFLQPRFDPSLRADLAAEGIEEGGSDGEEEVGAGRSSANDGDDEFRPFVRRLPEWQFWLSSTRATAIALLCTLSSAFDVPVYWPILLVYFCVLFALTMRRQIQHMIKYKYVPFDIGRKARYGATRSL
ncbi:hypothetical protein PLICRDRAFT_26046 [Plicaturopsis crispa FD-325 SS-3]|nr:hypothetical protein PLICRDRAFT_26046 [Plicaturopsis crispa FD-325 SS-3]